MSRRTLLPIALLALTACPPPAPAGLTGPDRAAIQAVADSAVAIVRAGGDWAATYAALYYTDDAMLLPPYGGPVTGRAAITEWLRQFPPIANFGAQQLDVEGMGDVVWVRGSYSMDVTPLGATTPVHDEGKYLEIWQRQPDGAWKVVRDMFSSSLPRTADSTR
jgi:ketosteroid isomerase-like protein